MKNEIRIELVCHDINAAADILRNGVREFNDTKSVRPLTLIGRDGLIVINEYTISEIHEDKAPYYKQTRLKLYRNMEGKEEHIESEL